MGFNEKVLVCDGEHGCTCPVSHIDEKGFAYCTAHGVARRAATGIRCRKLRVWELALLRAGKTLPSYTPRARWPKEP